MSTMSRRPANRPKRPPPAREGASSCRCCSSGPGSPSGSPGTPEAGQLTLLPVEPGPVPGVLLLAALAAVLHIPADQSADSVAADHQAQALPAAVALLVDAVIDLLLPLPSPPGPLPARR